MLTSRLLALLTLAVQLQPVVLPALCDDARAAEAGECDQPMTPTHAGLTLTGQQAHDSCLNPALCGIAQAATASSAVNPLSVMDSGEQPELLRPGVHAIDARAPLPPPPEA